MTAARMTASRAAETQTQGGAMTVRETISADFPFMSRYADVNGARMHYIEQGEGEPILFLHGNPTSSYLWRNIIPHLGSRGRCLAPDLIGMGKSDRPDLEYRFVDHARYVDGFIEALGLRNITLVLHDWGSALGFHYAARHPGNVRGLAFMEAIVKTFRWAEFPAGFRAAFGMMRAPVVGWLMVSVMNAFVKRVLPAAVARGLTAEERRRYAEPFPTVASRRPVLRWPREIPIDGRPADTDRIVAAYSAWLQSADLPKLLFFGHPGGIIGEDGLAWCRENIRRLETVDIGPGVHYLQEDAPHLIGRELAAWYDRI
jgi:haloalkane dehalogenase